MINIEKCLLIAEKPSLMRAIKDCFFKNRSKIPFDIDFVALSGHVCCYANPKEYSGWDLKWEDLTLPMIPKQWKIDVIADKAKMFSNLKNVITNGNYDSFICATDPEREGNLIYHLLESKLNLTKKKTYRLWINDTTDVGILRGFNNITNFHNDTFQRNLTLASVLRSRFDWVIGMNITVAASVKSGMVMKVGRVKTPTLNLVYQNSKAIDNFVPKTTYQIVADYQKGFTGIHFDGKEYISFENKSDAENALSKMPKTLKVINVEKVKEKTQPPQLYKLSDIQIEASKKYGYSPQLTLDIIQKLYDNQLVSYPRCDCRYISSALCDTSNDLLDSVACVPEFKNIARSIGSVEIEKIKKTKKYVNDDEVNKNSHTALVPTNKHPDLSSLSEQELNILKMIYKRFLCIFLPPLIEEKTVIIAENNDVTFKSNGKVVIDKGYTEFLETTKQDNILPNVTKGEILIVNNFSIKDKTSSPPARLTDGSLINEMENAGKYIQDEKLKKIMKETKGIGTQATRASIVNELIKDGYIDVKKQKKTNLLYISPKGEAYIENLSGLKIISPELTSEWEQNLREVEQGTYDSVKFNKEMLDFVNDLIKDISKMSVKRPSVPQKKVLGHCPRCGKDVIEGKKSYGCMGYKDTPKCDFSIWKDNKFFTSQGKKLTPTIVEKLLKDKSHKALVKGFKSKKGTKYDANVILDDSGSGFANIKIEFLNKKEEAR